MIYVQLSISSVRVMARHVESTCSAGGREAARCADVNVPTRVHTAHAPVKAVTFFFLFRREGEEGKGAEAAWCVRSKLLSTVARSSGASHLPLGRC